MKFYSDSSVQLKGFKIRIDLIKSKCSQSFFNVTKGIIESPNFPNNYNTEKICLWNITVPNGYFINLTFNPIFDITSSSQLCAEDYLLISKSGNFQDDVQR